MPGNNGQHQTQLLLMSLLINLRHLARKGLELHGELSVEELDPGVADEMVRLPYPAHYEVFVERPSAAVVVHGRLEVTIACVCVRCLKEFERRVVIEDWNCEVLPGDEETPVQNDCVDLTMRAREDILLALPQHPLCEPECPGLPPPQTPAHDSDAAFQSLDGGSVWTDLNKLKW
jgi:uncharacterized metal-binding protein YceD (DUF177 family)